MKKYVLVGTGHRGTMAYMVPLVRDLSDCVQLVAVCDKNPKRAKTARTRFCVPPFSAAAQRTRLASWQAPARAQ